MFDSNNAILCAWVINCYDLLQFYFNRADKADAKRRLKAARESNFIDRNTVSIHHPK